VPIPSGLAVEIDACAGRTYRAICAFYLGDISTISRQRVGSADGSASAFDPEQQRQWMQVAVATGLVVE
jgi:hypothetical protein